MSTHHSEALIQRRQPIRLAGLFLVAALSLTAAPFRDLPISFTQPDGTQIELRGTGDEFHAVFETLEGYTVVFDPALKAYCFAQAGSGGSLASSGVQVQRGNPVALGLAQHLRMDAAARLEQVRQRYQRWDKAMEIEQRWKECKAALQQREFQPDPDSPTPKGAQPNPLPNTTTGSRLGLTLLIDFDDAPATIPQADIEVFCNGDNYTGYGNHGSVKQYFYDNSNGGLTYSNVLTVYIRIPNSLHPKSYYNDTTKDCGDQGNLLIRDALDIMKALPNYTTDILPTFNNLTVDGNKNVIAFNVFYAGGNGGVWSMGLWPHSGALYNVGAQSLSPGGKKVYRYQLTNIGSSLTIGTFCHENGHMLCGYPDLYDYTYDSRGVGDWCLMSDGSYGGSPAGSNPSQICAYLKRVSGWATTTELTSTSSLTATVTATPGTNFNHFYRFQKPGVSSEYFLAECRYKTNHDADLPGSGVLVWHIDELGDNSTVNLSPNTIHSNYEATVVQADNLWSLEKNSNYGDANDLFFAGNGASGYTNQLSDSSRPNAHWWNGAVSGLKFTNFSAKAASMTFGVGDPLPAASFTASPVSGSAPLRNVTFTDTSTGVITNRSWNFGDGTIIPSTTATTMLHTYADAGIYSPSLTVTGPGGTSTTNRSNFIEVTNGPPAADFSAAPTRGPAALQVVFQNISSGVITQALWSFGDGTTNSTVAVTLTNTYLIAGSYSVGLIVSGPLGTSATNRSAYIVVTNAVPEPAFAINRSAGAWPLAVYFTNLSRYATDYVWSFGDGATSTIAQASHTYTRPGTYTVCLTATGLGGTAACCSNNLILVTNPPPNVVAVGDNSFGQCNVLLQATNMLAVAAGAWHNLALRSDGRLLAWGDNSYGQCNLPAAAQGAAAIAAGGYHSLAVRADGTVLAWGGNDFGEANVPAGLSNVIAAAAGTWHSLALRADGTVVAWGDNSWGQTNVPAGLNSVVAVAAGGNHSLALKANGLVAAWGENTDAQGKFVGQSVVPLGLTGVLTIAAGEYHSLAVKADGTVIAWGDNSQDQCSVPPGPRQRDCGCGRRRAQLGAQG